MILYGAPVATQIEAQVKDKIASLSPPPGLAVLIVGDDPASHTYVAMKQKACQRVGIRSSVHRLPKEASLATVSDAIHALNADPHTDAILLQLPLPSHLDANILLPLLDPQKDVDGFHPINMGYLLMGSTQGLVPCTPLGIHALLSFYGISVTGKHVVIVGRGQTVGRPLAALLLRNSPSYNALVTVVHRQCPDLSLHTRHADILIAATGSPGCIGPGMVKASAVLIDVGISRVYDPTVAPGYRLIGDVSPQAQQEAHAYTPVPKGIGPLTVAMLLQNTLTCYFLRRRCP